MTLILDLSLTNKNQAMVKVDGQSLGTFDPQPLLEDNPFTKPHTNLKIEDYKHYGDMLYRALHGHAWPSATLLKQAPHNEAMLAIRSIEPNLQAIPWEFLRIKQRWAIEDTLIARLVPITEHIRQTLEQVQPDTNKPYRLVIQRCEPLLWEQKECVIPLDSPEAVRHLDQLAQNLRHYTPTLPLTWHELAPIANALIRDIPVNGDIVLYHFTGHGDWNEDKPVLLFDEGNGRADPIDFTKLSQSMHQRVQLVFLNACHSADTQGFQANLALSMSQSGIPIVIGMQGQVEDSHAQQWASCFYPALAQRNNPLVALWQARLAMIDRERTYPIAWMQPALYMVDNYQWQSSNFESPDQPSIQQFPYPVLEQLQTAHCNDFIGRRNELIELATLLHRHRVVTIRGTGGIGKTALVAALARRVYWQFRDGIYAYSFANQAMPKLMAVLRWCAGWLNLTIDQTWQEDELKQQILQRLQGKQCLLVVDNYETILWSLGRQHEGIEHWEQSATTLNSIRQSQLEQLAEQRYADALAIHSFWQQFTDKPIKLVFTTRHSPTRLSNEVCYPPDDQFGQLQGLNEADGMALFYQWCGGTAQRNQPPDQQTIKLILNKIGTSPLAIQLAARRWATLPNPQPTTFVNNLDKHLAEAYVNDGLSHQRTLAINVRLSVEALAQTMQIALFQLSLLENSLILGLNAAVIWDLQTKTDETIPYNDTIAQTRLKELAATSLIQPATSEHDVYAFQPAILQTLRYLREQAPFQTLLAEPIQKAKISYGQFAEHMTEYIHSQYKKGIMDDLALRILPDLIAGNQYLNDKKAEKVMNQIHEIQGHFRTKTTIDEIINKVLILTKKGNLSLQDAIFQAIPDASETYNLLMNAEEISLDISMLDNIDDKHVVTLSTLAYIYRRIRSNLNKAQRLYDDCLTFYTKNGDQQGYAATLHELAYIHSVRSNYRPAESLYRQSLAIKDQLGDQLGQAATLHELGYLARMHGNYLEAKRFYQRSLAIKDQLGDQLGQAATLHELGYLARMHGNYLEAKRLYQQSLTIKDQLGDQKGRAATLHELGYLARMHGNYLEAKRLYQQSLTIKDQLGDQLGQAATLHELAYIARVRGDYTEAERLYREALDRYAKLGNLQGRAATLYELAYPSVVRNNFQEAELFYNESLDIYNELGDRQGISATLHALAYLAVMRGDYTKAEDLYHQSLAIKKELNDRQGISATLHELAYLSRVHCNFYEAKRLYQKSLAIKNDLGDIHGQASTMVMFGQLLIQKGESKGKGMIKQAYYIFSQLGAVREAEQTKDILNRLASQLQKRSKLRLHRRGWRQKYKT